MYIYILVKAYIYYIYLSLINIFSVHISIFIRKSELSSSFQINDFLYTYDSVCVHVFYCQGNLD